jgi:hypothetical protein
MRCHVRLFADLVSDFSNTLGIRLLEYAGLWRVKLAHAGPPLQTHGSHPPGDHSRFQGGSPSSGLQLKLRLVETSSKV